MPVTPAQYLGGSVVLTPEDIANMGAGSVVAIQKGLSSGTIEYHIGTRGARRYELEQYLKVLQFASNAAAAFGPDGSMSAIQTRRGVPCDV